MRMNEKKIYIIINMAVIAAAAALFAYGGRESAAAFAGMDFFSVMILTAAAILVHIIKAVRLYLALYGTGMERSAHLKIYCKVVPVSVILPLKLGEFFRMYCYGRQLGNALKGIVIIMLDRVVDTMALVTMILLVRLFYGGMVTPLVYIFIIFLAAAVLAYHAFPGIYGFWKKYILRSAATEGRLGVLKMLDMLYKVYREVERVVKGRGIILYCMSLAAWAVEIGNVILMDLVGGKGGLDRAVGGYLASALGGSGSDELVRFVLASVVLLMAFYIIMKAVENTAGKKVLG